MMMMIRTYRIACEDELDELFFQRVHKNLDGIAFQLNSITSSAAVVALSRKGLVKAYLNDLV